MFPFNQNSSAIAKRLPHVNIGGSDVGEGHPPIFLPDIDVYFKNDLSKALYLIDSIAEAGGKFLKGAVLHRQSLCLENAKEIQYFDKCTNEMVVESYHSIIARHVVPLHLLERIMEHGVQAGLKIVLSIYDLEGLEFAKCIGAVAVKIPSSNITHKSLIEAASSSGIPIIVDTGRSRFAEIIRAVDWVREKGGGARLILQHSPPGPPADPSLFHLRMMSYMSDYFSCPVGLSDHHGDITMIPIAVTLGAGLIEKGLIVDGASSDIDIAHALHVSRLKDVLNLIKESYSALGKRVRPDDEVPLNVMDRMCIIASRNIDKGEVITAESLDFAFPPVGIGAEDVNTLIGAKSKVPISKGQPVNFADIDVVYRL